MTAALEITSRAIRYCCMHDGAITALGSVPITADGDPIEALSLAPLPSNLGRVTVLLQHADLLMQTMVQGPCPLDRLPRIIRFELMSVVPNVEDILTNHLITPCPGDDIRLLVGIAKRGLVERLQAALKPHGGTLARLSGPACGLYAGWALQAAEDAEGCQLLVDCGGKHTHIAVVQGGDLLFVRTHRGGMDDIVEGIARLRGIENDEAQVLVARVGLGAPDDVRNLIRSTANSLSASITSVLRYASAQLKVPALKPTVCHLAGAGGQIPGFIEALAERSGWQVRLLNPFAGATAKLDQDALDRMVALPSPWATVIGAARSNSLPLDVMQQARDERKAYWSTHGVLRVAAVAAVALMLLAFARQWHASGVAARVAERLAAPGHGLVPLAESGERDLRALIDEKERDRARLQFLQYQLAPGKAANEFLAAVALSIDPQQRRVTINRYQLSADGDNIRILMSGSAQASGGRSLGAVLDDFRAQLTRHHPAIRSVQDLGSSIQDNSMVFQWEILLRIDGAGDRGVLGEEPPRRSRRGS
ncbi:MAG: hypothetical protein EA402_01800 [Planctomycetota bacterium]|nr:MAG: hypothetical protein EA402_01800 [Planctomycetota bacterium]